jgi:hypothetical protein
MSNPGDKLVALKSQIVEAYQRSLSTLKDVHRAFVLFETPKNSEYGVLECRLFFLVSKDLYFNIDRLYSATDKIRDFFEDEKNVCISYHFDPYTDRSVDIVPEGARAIYPSGKHAQTASPDPLS